MNSPNHSVSVIACCAVLALAGSMAPQQAAATPIAHKCGPVVESIIKTNFPASFTTSSTSFVKLPGAAAQVKVPAGQTRCVKVRLFVAGSCTDILCAIRPTIDTRSWTLP